MLLKSFLVLFLGMLAYGAAHSALASSFMKARLLPPHRRFYRLAFTLAAGLALLPLAWLYLTLPTAVIYRVPAPWSWLLWCARAAALLGMAITLLQTGLARFVGVTEAFNRVEGVPEKLQTGGLYRYARHPLYTATLVLLWCAPVMSWSYLGLALGATLYLFIGIQLEENKLLRQFGAAYRDYRARTPMLFPRLF